MTSAAPARIVDVVEGLKAAQRDTSSRLRKDDNLEGVADKGAARGHLGLAPLRFVTHFVSIQAAIDAVYEAGGGDLFWPAGDYEVDETIVMKRGVINRASPGSVRLRLADGANCNLTDSFDFDRMRANAIGSITEDADYTSDYGWIGFVFDCNAAGQTADALLFGVRMYGRRLHLRRCIITRSAGIGLHTCARGQHTGPYQAENSKLTASIDEVEIIYSRDECWIYEGPSDQPIGTVVTNGSGDQANDGAAPQTSRFYPGEEVSGVVWAEWGEFLYLNLNGTRFGRCFRSRGANRINGSNLIAAGGWGNIYIEAGAFGAIDKVLSQANPHSWGGVVHPHIENFAMGMHFGCTTVRRIETQDSGADGVKDSGGATWDQIKSRQSLSAGGTLLVVDAQGTRAAVDARGVATAIKTTAKADAINIDCYFNNVGLVWENACSGLYGSLRFRGVLNAGQSFALGVESGPGINKEALRQADISFWLAGVRKSNSFRGVQPVDTGTVGGKAVTFTHNLWRTPLAEEIQLTLRHSGFTAPAELSPPYVTGFSATTITGRLDVKAAHTGSSPVSQIICGVA